MAAQTNMSDFVTGLRMRLEAHMRQLGEMIRDLDTYIGALDRAPCSGVCENGHCLHQAGLDPKTRECLECKKNTDRQICA